jgi:hypothetical protein
MSVEHTTGKASRSHGGNRAPAIMVTAVTCLLLAAGCASEFTPPELITNLRVLGLSSEPAQLAPGEVAELRALIANPGGEPLTYRWEWCPFTRGANELYECLDDELGLPPAATALFDLGTDTEASLPYPGSATLLRSFCEALVEQGQDLAEFILLPDCTKGIDITVRLTVSTPNLERVAVRQMFLWFDTPEESARNHNPTIQSLMLEDRLTYPDRVIAVLPRQDMHWSVVVDASDMEPFLPGYARDSSEMRQEQIIFSFFTEAGELERPRTYADQQDFFLDEAGQNRLTLPGGLNPGDEIGVYFVVRDPRGGMTWESRTLRVTSL